MFRRVVWAFVVSTLLAACAGSDGHPPVAIEQPEGGSGGGGSATNTAGTGNAPTNSLFDGGFINIPDVSDIAYDEPRGVLYVCTTIGGLAIVDMATNEISSQKLGEHGLTGMDLSPDGRYLAIGENAIDADTREYWVHVLDLEENTRREVRLPILPMQLVDGSQSVAFASDNTLLATPSWMAIGQSPLMRINLADDAVESLKDVLSDTMLLRSADGNVVGFVEPVHGEGAFGEFDVASEELTRKEANIVLRDLGINADGTLLAFPSLGLFKIWGTTGDGFSERGGRVKENRDGVAAAFSPVGNSVYVAWSKDSATNAGGLVERYAVDTVDSEGIVAMSVPFATKRESGYTPTRMKLSSDGTLMFLTVEKGINVYVLEP